jgi:hypothetical protein
VGFEGLETRTRAAVEPVDGVAGSSGARARQKGRMVREEEGRGQAEDESEGGRASCAWCACLLSAPDSGRSADQRGPAVGGPAAEARQAEPAALRRSQRACATCPLRRPGDLESSSGTPHMGRSRCWCRLCGAVAEAVRKLAEAEAEAFATPPRTRPLGGGTLLSQAVGSAAHRMPGCTETGTCAPEAPAMSCESGGGSWLDATGGGGGVDGGKARWRVSRRSAPYVSRRRCR